MASRLHRLFPAALLLSLAATPLHAQARFDLEGPRIDVRVTRNGMDLPISTVPNLLPGDKVWLHPDLPPTQSVHYLLIAVFLRGTTNPPPDEWFTRVETWNKKVRAEGVTIVVPPEAQQAVLFLAPETGGDFSTLRSAVKGRPGIFVRATQDLTEAGFEQARTETYLAALRQLASADQSTLQQHSDLLARTLALKPNPDCFKRPIDQQYNCLTQTGAQTLLDDGHGQTVVAALSTGPGSDFINAASNTSLAGGGTYSAYVGTLVDFVHIMSGLHTAQYQYIPAIASPQGEALNLRLNTPPSFHNPKSVLVISLPAIQPAVLPPLRAADPNHISCLLEPKMVLPIEGAPLVFSTAFAHDLVLHVNAAGQEKDIPLSPDPFQGGLALMPSAEPERHELPTELPNPNMPGAPEYKKASPAPKPPDSAPSTSTDDTIVTGTVKGVWGFDPFSGPTLPLQRLPGQNWTIVTTPKTPTVLIAGQPNHLELTSTGTACLKAVSVEPGDTHADWKLAPPPKPAADAPAPAPAKATTRPVELTLNLQHATTPGNLELAITQYGEDKPDKLNTRTFSEPAKIDSLTFHAGDTSATLTGSSLGQVRQLTLADLTFNPQTPNPGDPPAATGKTSETLTLNLPFDTRPPAFKPGEHLTARVSLRDDRTLDIPVTVEAPRPDITILSRHVSSAPATTIRLASADDLPLGAQLVFFLKSPAKYPRDQQVEIANSDESLHASLNVANGSLVMQDAHTVFATVDPLKLFGPSIFGALKIRALAPDGTPGPWLPLATVVRLPTLDQLQCTADATQPCALSGSSLFLLDAVSSDPAFTQPTPVPEGYVDPTLQVPHPQPAAPSSAQSSGILYLRLRDDPATIQQATVPMPDAPHHATNHGMPKIAPKPDATSVAAPPAAPPLTTPAPAPPTPTTETPKP